MYRPRRGLTREHPTSLALLVPLASLSAGLGRDHPQLPPLAVLGSHLPRDRAVLLSSQGRSVPAPKPCAASPSIGSTQRSLTTRRMSRRESSTWLGRVDSISYTWITSRSLATYLCWATSPWSAGITTLSRRC